MANTPRQNYAISNQQGFTETYEIADVGPGNSWIFTVPPVLNNWRYKVLSLSFTFVTALGGAARTVGLRFFRHTGAYNWWRWYFPQTQLANQTFFYVLALNYPDAGFWNAGMSLAPNGHRYSPFPDVEFTSWERFGFSTAFMQPGDEVLDTTIMIRRWIDDRD